MKSRDSDDELRRSDLQLRRKGEEVSELFAHLFTALVLCSTLAFVLAGAIVIFLQ
jgi:hypothetical protein